MKNAIKIFSLMLIAGITMVSCEKDPTTPTTPVTPKYTITVTANNDAYGTVTGGGTYDSAATATLTATANEGYKFVNWNDGNANNPRIVTVTANASYTANFEELAGVNVTFGDLNWTAQYVNCVLYPNAILVAAAQNASSNQLPIIQLVNIWQSGSPSTGSYTGTHNVTDGVSREGAYLYYFAVEDDLLQLRYQDGSTETVGDWWSKDLTLNITTLDADAMNLSLVVNTTMVHASEMVGDAPVDWNSCSTRPLTLNVINQSMTAPSTKTRLAEHNTAKLSIR